jgi:hypothetical protein
MIAIRQVFFESTGSYLTLILVVIANGEIAVITIPALGI